MRYANLEVNQYSTQFSALVETGIATYVLDLLKCVKPTNFDWSVWSKISTHSPNPKNQTIEKSKFYFLHARIKFEP